MRKTNEINLRKQIRFSLKPEKPLTCSEQEDYPRLPKVLFFWGGRGNAFLPRPFPIFDLVHNAHAVHSACLSTDEQLFTRTAFTQ